MTKKKGRIRYSALDAPAPHRDVAPDPIAPSGADAGTAAAIPRKPRAKSAVPDPVVIASVVEGPVGIPSIGEGPAPSAELALVLPRARRNSSPVELAHALAAAHAAEIAAQAKASALEEGAADASDPDALDEGERGSPRARARVEEMLMFRLGDERFAVELLAVEEVIDLPVIHHVPEMPPAMLGVVTVRGFLTPVYSPHTALGVPLAMKQAVLIFRRGRSRVGILIDDVEDAVSLDLGELRSAPSEHEIDNVVLGVVRHAGVLVAIVDADALIAACQAAAFLEMA